MTNTYESTCKTTLRNMDAYLDNELGTQAAAALRQHVDECAACAREVNLRRQLRARLRQAASGEGPSAFLETRVRAALRQHERRTSPWMQRSRWVPAAVAALMLTLGLSVAYQLGHLRFTVAAQNSYVDQMLQKVAFGMRPGLSDHIHCAVFRKYPQQPPSIGKLTKDLGPEYKPVLEIAQARLPREFTLYMAHHCTFRDRAFVHLALRSDSNLISLVLTRRRPGESLSDSDIAPVISRGGLHLYGASAQRFHMSGFETPMHFAYLVTDISAAQTQRMMLAMGPELRAVLARLAA